MNRRGPLLLILFAIVIVTGGFASPIHKSPTNDGFAFYVASAEYSLGTTDNWLGGTGNWSDPSLWTGGLPSTDSSVYINGFGHKDDVVSLYGSYAIASLTLGCSGCGYNSTLTGEEGSLVTSGDLTIHKTGTLKLILSTVTVGGDATNSGQVSASVSSQFIVNGLLTNEEGGSLSVDLSGADIGRLDNLGTVSVSDGSLIVRSGGLNNAKTIDLEGGGEIIVHGDMNNSDTFSSGAQYGGNTITIDGKLTNSGQLTLNGAHQSDSLSAGSIDNNAFGSVVLTNGSTLTVNEDVSNTGHISTGIVGESAGGNVLNIAGTLTNGGSLTLNGGAWNEPGDSATVGTLENNGTLTLGSQSTLTVNRDAVNHGQIYVSRFPWTDNEHNTLTIKGALYNDGLIHAMSTGDLIQVSSDVYNSGTISLGQWPSMGVMTVGGNFVNDKAVSLNTSWRLQVADNFDNYGTIWTGSGMDGGNALVVGGTLTNYLGADLSMSGWRDSANVGKLVNAGGSIELLGGAKLSVAGDANNSGTISINSAADASVRMQVTGTMTNTADGLVLLYGNYNADASFGKLVNNGVLDLDEHSSLTVTSTVDNSGTIATDYYGKGGDNTLTINGKLTNTGSFLLNGPGDSATVGGVDNSGSVTLSTGSTLTVNGNLENSVAGSLSLSHASLVVNGRLENDTFTGGSVSLNNASTLTVNGDLYNVGQFYTTGGGNTLTVTGLLDADFNFTLNGPNDSARVGELFNRGYFGLGNHSTLTVNGNATNAWVLDVADGSAMVIGGTLGNNDLHVNGSTVQVRGQGASLNTDWITLANGSTMQITGDLTNTNWSEISTGSASGDDSGNNQLWIDKKLTNNGTVALYSPGDTVRVANVLNTGTVSIANGANFIVTNGGRAAAAAASGFTNSGTVNIAHGGKLASLTNYIQSGGQTTVDGTLSVSGRGLVNLGGGSLFGNQGTIIGPVFSNASINMGDGPLTTGKLNFMGDYTQGPNGSLTFDIGGSPSSGDYDQLNISGHAQLFGMMTVDLIHGFVPQIGDEYDVMNFSGVSGNFSYVIGLSINGQEHFALELNPTNLTLDVVAGALFGSDSKSGVSPATAPLFVLPEDDGATLVASNITSNAVPGNASGTNYSSSSRPTPHGIAPSYGQSSPTPEPGSLVLLVSGLLCVGYSVRRRMTK